MNVSAILSYLSELELHNEREWYHANKVKFQKANTEFLGMLSQLIGEIGKTDSDIINNEPRDLTFKLVRDTRFSHDKSPYNPAFRAHISSKGKLPIPVGYYIKIQPNNRSFLGGGLFADIFKEATVMIRNHIVTHGDEWQKIINENSFSDMFSVKGKCLKNVPRGYDPTPLQAQYIKHKSWYVEYPISDDQLKKESFVNFATDIFIRMQPFNTFLNDALTGFVMPKR